MAGDPHLLPLKDGRGKHGDGRAPRERRNAVRDAMASIIHLPLTFTVRGTYISLCCILYMMHIQASSLWQALEMCKACPNSAGAAQEQTIIWRDGDDVCIRIARRKNRPKGSGTLRRRCTCKGGASTCAVHMLWDQYFAKLEEGTKPWHPQVDANKARTRLRQLMRRLGIVDAEKYGTQDCRRGHAEVLLHLRTCVESVWASGSQDMRRSGCTLAEMRGNGNQLPSSNTLMRCIFILEYTSVEGSRHPCARQISRKKQPLLLPLKATRRNGSNSMS